MSDAIHVYAFDGAGNQVLAFASSVVPPVGAVLQAMPSSERGWVVVSQRWQIRKDGAPGSYAHVGEVLLRVLPEEAPGSGNQAEPAGTEAPAAAATT